MAVSLLKKEGYGIEAINYRCPCGEVDIIARDKGTLAFVEVKTRVSERFGSGAEAVDYRKQKRLNRIALYYLGSLDKSKGQQMCRFDVVSITRDQQKGWNIELIKDAFPLFPEDY
ncbi:YraN family protein [bacterium]|nr:YraN family protein [bacterium]